MKKTLSILTATLFAFQAWAQNITPKQGDALSILLVFQDTITAGRQKDMSAFLGVSEIGRKSLGTIKTTNDKKVFRIDLASKDTKAKEGTILFQLATYDSTMGVRRITPIPFKFLSSNNTFNNTAISTTVDVTINVDITSLGVTSNVTLATVQRGYSAYDIAVQAGYSGTEFQWTTAFNTAINSVTTSAASATAAAASATTASTQATNAATSATAASTSATNSATSATAAANSAAAAAASLTSTMLKANNLSDVANAATARTNLGLGTASTLNVAASGNAASGEAVKGDDTRLTTLAANLAAKTDTSTIATKLETLTSIAGLQAYNKSSYALFDGSTWEKKSGNVTSNGGGAAGTLIRVGSTSYWERITKGYPNPDWFGAVADGVTDDYAAFNAAIAIKGEIELTPGKKYAIGGRINAAAKLIIHGSGDTLVVKSGFPTSGSMYEYGVINAAGVSNVKIENLTINGTAAAAVYSNSWSNLIHIICITNCSNVSISNVNIINAPSSGILIGNSIGASVYNTKVYRPNAHGIFFHDTQNVRIENCDITGIGDMGSDLTKGGIGIFGQNGSYADISNNRIDYMSDTGTKTEGVDYVKYDRNTVTRSGKDGLKVMSSTTKTYYNTAVITNNIVSYIYMWRLDGGNLIMVADVINAVVSGNIIRGGRKSDGVENGIMASILSYNPVKNKNIKITENTIVDCPYSGIRLNNGNENCDIIANKIAVDSLTTAAYGVYITNSNNVRLSNNSTKSAEVGLYCTNASNVVVENGNNFDLPTLSTNVNSCGIFIYKVAELSIKGSYVNNFYRGIYARPSSSQIVDIEQNTVTNIGGSAIYVSTPDTIAAYGKLILEANRIVKVSRSTPSAAFYIRNTNGLTATYTSFRSNYIVADGESNTTPIYCELTPVLGTVDLTGLAVYGSAVTASNYYSASTWTKFVGLYTTAYPTSGTWALGDIVYNSNVSTGVEKWICTTAGTSGTWTAVEIGPFLKLTGGTLSGLITDAGGMSIGAAQINRSGNVEMQFNAAGNVRFFGNGTAGNIVTIATSGLITAKTYSDGFITWGSAAINRTGGDINLQPGQTGGNGVIIQGSRFYNSGLVIGSTSLNVSAAFEINSTSKGFLPPRMTSAQRDAISSPAPWLVIICTDCTATDGSTGVMQTLSGATWKNHW